MKLPNAADLIDEKIQETLTYYKYPDNHWVRIRTNNALERIMREIRTLPALVSTKHHQFQNLPLVSDSGNGGKTAPSLPDRLRTGNHQLSSSKSAAANIRALRSAHTTANPKTVAETQKQFVDNPLRSPPLLAQ